MLCVVCNHSADYVFNGRSVCLTHLNQYRESTAKLKTEYQIKLRVYVGSQAMLMRYFNFLAEARQIDDLPIAIKLEIVTKCNELADRYSIEGKFFDAAIAVAIKRNVAEPKYFYTVAVKMKDASIQSDDNVVDKIKKQYRK